MTSTEPTSARQRLLALRVKQKQAQKISAPITRRSGTGPAPLTHTQRRAWFLAQLDPDSTAYHEVRAYKLRGPVDVDALRESLCALIARHEILRTTYAPVDDEARQFVHDEPAVDFEVVDLRSRLALEGADVLRRSLAETAREPFDLARGPLLRFRVIRLDEDDAVLLRVWHHIIADGWSAGVFERELSALYNGQVAGQPVQLPPLPIQYADYALWQRQWLAGAVLEQQLAYWKTQLADLATLALPTDRPRPALQSDRGAQVDTSLPTEVSDGLNALARAEGATLFMAGLAAFKVLLYRYSGTTDIAIGTPIASRGRPELEGLIGFFANTLVLRTDLSGAPTFRQVLARVRDTAVAAYTHQDLPFEKLVEELAPPRDLSRNPLFQVSFAVQNLLERGLTLHGLEVERVDLPAERAKFDLSLDLRERDGTLQASFEYCTDLFERGTIERLAGHFGVLLGALLANPDQSIDTLPLMSDAERDRILVAWNDTAEAYPKDQTLAERFEAQVRRTPAAPAVIHAGHTLTYAQLNARANQLARYLRARGVEPDVPVALCLERGPDLIVGLLGIVKAGGAYVPLDADQPGERLSFLLQDSAAGLALTQASLLGRLPAGACQHLCLDRDWTEIAAHGTDDLPNQGTAQQRACLMYTSGSTGTPKGVAIRQQGVIRLVTRPNYVDLGPADTMAQVSNVAFDAATFEIWGALLNGARLAILPRDIILSPPQLVAALQAHHVTCLFLSTALFNRVSSERPDAFKALRHVLFGGETCDPDRVRAVMKAGPPGRLVHVYGPTETTTFATFHVVRANENRATIPIGRPISGTQVLLLDPHGELVPPGVVGEIHIGGLGVAAGYVNRPAETRAHFVPHPFDRSGGSVLYRTGDLARWLADGSLEFVGRNDDQVKIRGFRIEPAEIRAVLATHPEVRACHVMLRRQPTGDIGLTAYVLVDGSVGQRLSPDTLRRFLGARLPAYMLPTSFVPLASLPLTSNGKVDSRALPEPQHEHLAARGEYVAPGTVIECLIAAVWTELLGLQRVGVNDDFFALGGHSLLAGQLAARLVNQCGVELPLRRIFESPTVAELAREVERLRGAGQTAQALPITPVPRTCPLPLSFAQESLWFLDQLNPDGTAYNLPLTFRMSGPLNARALRSALGVLIERHESLRTHFATIEGEARQLIAAAGPVDMVEQDLRALNERDAEARARELVQEEADRRFDLARGPLLRVLLIRLAEHEHVLSINAHHIITDGWSNDVLMRELQALYGAFRVDRADPLPPLPPLPIQYADYAVWQRDRLQGARFDNLMGYWREKLAGLKPLSLPMDRPRSGQLSYQGGTQTRVIPANLAGALRALAIRHNGTLFMVLLSAFQLLLMRLSGQDDVAVGSPVAGRDRAELDGLIGLFLNTLVLRTDLSGAPTFEQLLARTRQTALDAYAHQDMPFERLVAALNPARELNHNPLFDVMINHIDGEAFSLDLPGLLVRQVRPDSAWAKFALTLYIGAHQDSVDLRLVYQSDLFSPERAGCMLDQFVGLLRQIVTSPQQSIHAYSLVTPGSRTRLPDPCAVIDEPAQHSVVEQVLAWAQRSPEQVAVRTADRHWTYAELVARATSLAKLLRSRGIGRCDVVAIVGPRGFGVVGAMLAVLMSGGAFLTIDPALPAQRRRVMLNEARARAVCLFAQPAGSEQELELDSAVTVLHLAFDLSLQPGLDVDAQAGVTLPMPHGDDPAYVFFTSGSTGQPKGILGCHKGLSHFLGWQRETFAISADDRVSQLISLTFDPLLRDVFLPLTSGAMLCIPADGDLLDTIGWLDREGVTVVHTTPTVMQSWLRDDGRKIELRRLRRLFISGEPLTDTLVNRWRLEFPGQTQLVNLYGPTETTMVRCFYPIPAIIAPGIQPIGTPLPESQALVLNRAGQLCGIGETGEILLRTPFRSLGYLNLPGENTRCFRPNPFRDAPGDIVYATGDRGRYRPDGLLEIAGRVDDQVKIRGVRVEPGEVAASLLLHAAIRECIVVAREDRDGQRQLVGYMTCKPGTSTDASALRAHLKVRLPEVFIPGAFVFLDAMPQLPNGKVDRRALPAPPIESKDADRAAPRSPLEQAVADTWCEVLGLEVPGIHDDFFALGGHSLLAIRLVSRLNRLGGVNIPLRQVFELPTIAGLASAIEYLRGVGNPAQYAAIGRVARTGIEPLSFAQQRLWFLDQLMREGASYNIVQVIDLEGLLDIEALTFALDEVVARHESLRTTFTEIDGHPGQIVHASLPITITQKDITALATVEREAMAIELTERESARGFDLTRGPLLRVLLIRLATQRYRLVHNIHHIVSDGWSTGVFERELSVLYTAQVAGIPAKLPGLPIQYADYALWQRQWLSGAVLEQQLSFWKQQMAHLATLRLPTDRRRPVMQSDRGAHVDISIPAACAERLKAMARAEGATLFMAGLAAFKVLLYRYGGSSDIAIGTPIAGRGHTDLEGLIGFFANTLVLRTDLSGAPTFRQVLARVRDSALGAYTHQDLPFEKLVEELAPVRDLSRNPLFQVCFAMQSTSVQSLSLSGISSRRVSVPTRHAKFDLTLTLRERDGQMQARFEYCTDLFERGTIERLAGHFEVLLGAILASPEQSIDTLALTNAAERDRLLVQWNDTAAAYPGNKSLAELFEAQVRRTPDATAVECGGERLSYAGLDVRAGQIAARLQAAGMTGGAPVAVCLERSVDLLAAVLGVLRAGGHYLPLDPGHPPARLAFVLQDSGAQLLVRSPALAGQPPAISPVGAPSGATVATPAMIAPEGAPTGAPTGAPAGSSDPPAYLIYTSGSTGQPKGVLVPQRAVVNFLTSMATTPGLGPGDRLLAVTTLAFDIAVLELLLPLTVGATTVIAGEADVRDPQRLMRLIEAAGITVMQATPAMWRNLLAAGWGGRAGLRLLCGGEALDRDLATELLRRGAELWNLYGPTETTVWSCIERVGDDEGPVSIGRPIANTRCYVLDGQLQPVPIGVIGELYIGGAGLALGYVNRPELTAERFIADPFRPGERLYRTGDLVRYLPNGAIAFAGRNDQQVKVRGYRIELGEIEAALNGCAGVRQSVVMAREDQPGLKRLVAYVAGEALNKGSLLEQLKQQLPEYMVPTTIVFLKQLPVLPNGKLDRGALPLPQSDVGTCDFVAPRSPLEQVLCDMWRDILGKDRIGVRDSFFELGGHSLLATQIVARVRRTLGIELPLRVLFEAPTVAGLAEAIDQIRRQHGPDHSSGSANDPPPAGQAHETGSPLAPIAVLESELTGLWVSALGVRSVGRDETFTTLSGDLFRGKRLLDDIKALFDVELPIESLFGEASSVAAMAQVIDASSPGHPRMHA